MRERESESKSEGERESERADREGGLKGWGFFQKTLCLRDDALSENVVFTTSDGVQRGRFTFVWVSWPYCGRLQGWKASHPPPLHYFLVEELSVQLLGPFYFSGMMTMCSRMTCPNP